MDLSKPFERLTMVDAVKKYAGVDWNEVKQLNRLENLQKNIMLNLKNTTRRVIS